ncbi:MAG: hypothetical protein DHS20C11_13200 [Lysobacteraceae bacterium]|nr:MAG: hypothetical protein DHS20C11_13200 [Xanthomonadaceae bacterium]
MLRRNAPIFLIVIMMASPAWAQEVQSLEHDRNVIFNSLVQVDADTYALAYSGDGSTAFKTFTISADGSTITQVQSVAHDPNEGEFYSLVQVDGDTYALAYMSNDGGGAIRGRVSFSGVIKTFTIPADGSTITQVQSLEHDAVIGEYNSLTQVDADTYALAYTGDNNDGFIKTFTIPADGSTITQVQSLEHDTSFGRDNSLVQVDADTYALAYTGAGSDGFIKTFTISADGSTITQVQTLEHDTLFGRNNSLVQVDADTYALAYTGDGVDGFIKTFTIPADGSTITQVQSLEHDTVSGQYNSLTQVDTDTYALAYAGDGDDGFLKTFTIPADGSTITQVESLEHDTLLGRYNSLVQVDADTYALAYNGDANDGLIKTFTIHAGGMLPVTLESFSVD